MNSYSEITVWDVLHGNCITVHTPDRQWIVIDLGLGSHKRNSLLFSPLQHLMQTKKLKKIDLAILTHPHKEHIEDIFTLAKLKPSHFWRPDNIPPEKIIPPGVLPEDKPIYEKYIEMDNRYPAQKQSCIENTLINSVQYGALSVKTFCPGCCAHDTLDNRSLVTLLTMDGVTVVVAGDNEHSSYRELMKLDCFTALVEKQFILVAAHHGRNQGWDDAFINLAKPALSIISDYPKQGTSALLSYSHNSRSYTVGSLNGMASETRKTLTTYNDGDITIFLGKSKYHPMLAVLKK
jgi:beta-lactamase superfamily II metal-dependent hydrolase